MREVLKEIVEPVAGARGASESVDNDEPVAHRFLRTPGPDQATSRSILMEIGACGGTIGVSGDVDNFAF